ncbi:MAG: efflux RND transporter periplasmic adaptor subunit [Vicinamibacterales bacterium]
MLRSLVRILPLLIVAACGGGAPQGQGGPGGAGGAFPPMDVAVLTLAPKPIPQTSEYVATIRSLRSTTVQSQVEGIVRRIYVKAGDRVEAGQPLLQVDPDKQQATLTAVESQRAAREADVALAQQQLARARTLFEAGAVSRSELEQAEASAKTTQAQLDAVASQIREARVQLDYYRLTAPAAGIAGEITIREGDRVTPSTAITTIDQPQGLEAYINVPLERAALLRPGLEVELIASDGAVIASDPVTFVAPRADDATQSVLVKVTLGRMPPSIRVMQYLRARIIWSNEPRLTVPVVAISRISGQYFVFVAEQGPQGTVARQKPVTVAEVIGDDYVIMYGLKAGDRVIVSNLQKLGDGAPVKAS